MPNIRKNSSKNYAHLAPIASKLTKIAFYYLNIAFTTTYSYNDP